MRYLAIVFVIFFILACSPASFDEILSNKEPFKAVLNVINFQDPRTVILHWQIDSGAEEYLLYRDIDPQMSNAQLIYQGSNNQYKDSMLDTSSTIFYYYQLEKRRGNVIYPKSNVVMGVASNYLADSFEHNNTRDRATRFIDSNESNIYLFKDKFGNTVEDIDWFYVDVQAEHSVIITFQKNGDLGDISDEDLLLYLENQPNNPLTAQNGVNISINNTTKQKKRIYFYVMVNPNQFIDSTSGGKFGFYRIDYVREEHYIPV